MMAIATFIVDFQNLIDYIVLIHFLLLLSGDTYIRARAWWDLHTITLYSQVQRWFAGEAEDKRV